MNEPQGDTTPQYEKSPFAPQWEYHQMTWEMFLIIREWAQEVAYRTGYPVYLVGSTLWKVYPRDVDIAIILPLADFEARFGTIPTNEAERRTYLERADYVREAHIYGMTLSTRLRYALRVDCKMAPDGWFPGRDRLLLATSDSHVMVREWAIPRINNVED